MHRTTSFVGKTGLLHQHPEFEIPGLSSEMMKDLCSTGNKVVCNLCWVYWY